MVVVVGVVVGVMVVVVVVVVAATVDVLAGAVDGAALTSVESVESAAPAIDVAASGGSSAHDTRSTATARSHRRLVRASPAFIFRW